MIRIVCILFSIVWLFFLWLWFFGINILTNMFLDKNSELGILFVFFIAFITLIITIAGSVFTYRKKMWILLFSYLALGGVPLFIFSLGVIFG